jgi:orotidine-5'-phosphate decarboxylase
MSLPKQFPSSLESLPPTARLAREEARQRLIVALDVQTAQAAMDLVHRLEGTCRWFKVGLELFAATGPAFVERLSSDGHSVFLDLKFHDIPNTVAGAVRSAAGLGVRMMTLHALGGPAMLAAARAEVEKITNPPELLAVTVLTSMDEEQLNAVGLAATPAEEVERLARVGLAARIRGFVCSPQEVAALRSLAGPEAVLVVPGIRPTGSELGDQKRVATPAETLRRGASFLVVGRPITQAGEPAEAASGILDEMVAAL